MSHHLEGPARVALRSLVARLRADGLFEREIARVLALRRATVQALLKESRETP